MSLERRVYVALKRNFELVFISALNLFTAKLFFQHATGILKFRFVKSLKLVNKFLDFIFSPNLGHLIFLRRRK